MRAIHIERILVVVVLTGIAACSTSNVAAVAQETERNGAARQCPQPRTMAPAPASYLRLVNPLPQTEENIEKGRVLYQAKAKPVSCASCHGAKGAADGPRGADLIPPPRNFTCVQTMAGLSDGQLYWAIENGSGEFHAPSRQGAQQIPRPGRGVPPSARGSTNRLNSTDIWQLVLYIRSLEGSGLAE